jgi:hypothetical protein
MWCRAFGLGSLLPPLFGFSPAGEKALRVHRMPMPQNCRFPSAVANALTWQRLENSPMWIVRRIPFTLLYFPIFRVPEYSELSEAI